MLAFEIPGETVAGLRLVSDRLESAAVLVEAEANLHGRLCDGLRALTAQRGAILDTMIRYRVEIGQPAFRELAATSRAMGRTIGDIERVVHDFDAAVEAARR